MVTKKKDTKEISKIKEHNEIKKEMPKDNGVKLTFEQLFESKKFRDNYQYDFSKVVLGKNTYTPKEAENKLKEFFKKEV